MAKQLTAIYPGSFDPVTNGHVDIIARSRGIFDRVIVAVLGQYGKETLFHYRRAAGDASGSSPGKWDNVQIETFEGLLVNYALAQKAQVILRGIRAVTDYEYEFQMALMNRRMQPRIETVFMVPAEAYTYLSSRLVKEIFLLGGSVEGLVPSGVQEFLNKSKKVG